MKQVEINEIKKRNKQRIIKTTLIYIVYFAFLYFIFTQSEHVAVSYFVLIMGTISAGLYIWILILYFQIVYLIKDVNNNRLLYRTAYNKWFKRK